MKQLLLLGVSLIAVSACAMQQPSNPPPTTMAQPVGAPVGSSTNTTNAFDGAYDGNFIHNMSVGRTNVECPDLRIAPALTIRNGLAQFQGANGTFQGYVTPQGAVTMQSAHGDTFQGQIDPYFVLTGRATGPLCTYDTSWKRSKIY